MESAPGTARNEASVCHRRLASQSSRRLLSGSSTLESPSRLEMSAISLDASRCLMPVCRAFCADAWIGPKWRGEGDFLSAGRFLSLKNTHGNWFVAAPARARAGGVHRLVG